MAPQQPKRHAKSRVQHQLDGRRAQRPEGREARHTDIMDRMQRKLNELENRQKRYWTPEVGLNKFRIGPSWRGPNGDWYLEVARHFEVGPERWTVVCPRMSAERCPLCERAEKYAASDDPRLIERAAKLFPRLSFAVNVLPRIDGLEQFLVWTMAPSLIQEFIGYFVDPDYGDFTHPKNGFDVTLRRQGKGLSTRYKTPKLSRMPSPVGLADWQHKLHNLDKQFTPKAYGDIIKIAKGEMSRGGGRDND